MGDTSAKEVQEEKVNDRIKIDQMGRKRRVQTEVSRRINEALSEAMRNLPCILVRIRKHG